MVVPLPAAEPPKVEMPNIQSKTLGGQYVWADELVYFGWHIQRSTFTGHCRLIVERIRATSQNGQIIRKRTKNEEHDSVPTVTYELWETTDQLLRKHMETSGDWLLLNSNGEQLCRSWIGSDGKAKHVDNIVMKYKRLVKKDDDRPTLKQLLTTFRERNLSHGRYPAHRFESAHRRRLALSPAPGPLSPDKEYHAYHNHHHFDRRARGIGRAARSDYFASAVKLLSPLVKTALVLAAVVSLIVVGCSKRDSKPDDSHAIHWRGPATGYEDTTQTDPPK